MKRFVKYLFPIVFAVVMICMGVTAVFASESDNVSVKFVDSDNRVIKTTELAPGAVLDTSDANATVFSARDGKVKLVEGWYINLGTEISANGFSYTDKATLGVNEITVYPKMTDEKIIDTFAVYTKDSYGIDRLFGSLDDYDKMSSIASCINNAPDRAFITLLYDKDTPYDMGARTSFAIGAGKTINFDLNGRILVQSYASTSGYGGYMFTVNEQSTFNVYSSVSGGAFYQARFNTTNQNNYVFAPGLIGVNSTVDTAYINVGDIYDKDGKLVIDCADDFSLYGGTLVFVISSKNAGNGKININVNGGFYYHSMRSGYALFTVQAPDVYINMNNAKVYNSNTTYSVVHDYSGHMSESHFTARNSEFICRNAANTVNTTFYHRFGENSTAYFEDCVIMAKASASNQGGVITLGEGNIIAGNMLEEAVLEEGVLFGKQNDAVLKRYITHPPLYAFLTSDPVPILKDENGKWAINPIVFDKTQWVYDAEKSCEIAAGTYRPDGSRTSVKEVQWFDKDGKQVGDSEYWVIGSKLIHKEFETIRGEWYDIECCWCYADGTFATDVILDKDSECLFYAKPQKPIGRVSDKLANLTLSERITFNLYLPIYSSVTVDSITASSGDVKIEEVTFEGKTMYRISWDMPYGSFDTNTVKLNYSVDSFGDYDELSSSKSFECLIELDFLRYASLLASSSLCNSKESVLAYELVNYVKTVAALDSDFSQSSVPNLEEFLLAYDNTENHIDGVCICKSTSAEDMIERSDSAVNYDAIKQKGVESIDFLFSKDAVGIRVFVKDRTVKIDSVTCTDSSGRLVALPFTFVEEENYYFVSGISAMYLDNVITVNSAKGASGTYSLARFIFDYSGKYLKDYEEHPVYRAATSMFVYARLSDQYNAKK